MRRLPHQYAEDQHLGLSAAPPRSITADPDDAAIASGLISLAHSLRLRVVSEQVETAEQLELLRDRGCDLVQGYFLSRPLDADSCTMLLRKGIDNVYLNPRSKARPHLVALSILSAAETTGRRGHLMGNPW